MSARGRPGSKALRRALAASVAFAFIVGAATSADAAIRKKKRYFAKSAALSTSAVKKTNPERDGFADVPKGGVLQVAISIGSQRLTLYRDGVRVATSPVSTGTASHPTPTGVFSVIEKDRWHRSNLYGNAPMWFMQRVTWSGVAMHEGMLPGYPASHGCIRLPREFAARLWPTTKLGVRVVIARSEVAPVEFQHPALFAPTPKPAEPKVAMIAPTDGAIPGRPLQFAEAATTASDAAAERPDRARGMPAAKPAAAAVDDAKPADTAAAPAEAKPAAAAIDHAKPSDTKPSDTKPVDTAAAPTEARSVEGGKAEPIQTAADGAVTATGAIVPVPPAMDPSVLPNELRKAVEAPQPAPVAPASPATTPAAAPASNDPAKPEPGLTDPPKPPALRTKSADQPAKQRGQVAVFVSRKEKKIFVRQGFIPLFDMPITIASPDQPLGTHVFTAMAVTDDGAGMRWNLITMPTSGLPPPERRSSKSRAGDKKKPKEQPVVDTRVPSTAAAALDRIQMPKEAVERISELLIPGSSLVVSDEGLGRETGRYTDFIVLTR